MTIANESYSERVIRDSKMDDFSCMKPLHLIYGVVTPCSSWDFRVKIDSTILSQEEMEQRLMQLSEATKRRYVFGIIQSKEGEEGEFDGLAVIGRPIEGKDYGGDQSSIKLVRRRTLIGCLKSEQLLGDLRTLGFKDIIKEDLFLYAKFYND